jgi:hypothetical protein
LLKSNASSNPEYDELLHLALDWNEACSLKVRKIRLLQALDLPLDETHVFPKEVLKSNIILIINAAKALLLTYKGVLIRTAWTPDLFGAPWFKTSNFNKLKQILYKLGLRTFDRSNRECHFTHVILHGDLSKSNNVAGKSNWIAGRLLIHPLRDSPTAKTLEVVHGEYIAKIFDTKGFDMGDDHFAGYENKVGQVCWHPFKKSSLITTEDIRVIVSYFEAIDDKVRRLMQVLSYATGKSIAELALCLEFGFSIESHKLFFIYDFDFAFPPTFKEVIKPSL